MKLREEEKKCLELERCVRDLETALAEKEREAVTCAQKVQDSLVTYLDSNTAAEQLREQRHRLEIENTRLEGTVHRNNERIEALQRDLAASASVSEISQQLHVESKKCMQLEAQNRDLQEKLSTLHGKCEELEKSKCQLKEEVAKLHFHMESNTVDCRQKDQCKREVEEKANQERRQHQQEVNLFIEAQATSQDALEQNRASCWDSLRNQAEEGSRDLEGQLDRMKNTQQDSTFPKESVQAEEEKYKELYLEEVNIRKCLAKNLERLEKLLTIERRKVRLNEVKETESCQEEMQNRYSEKVNEVDRLKTEVSEISQQLDMESKKCMQLQAQNWDLEEELSSLRRNCEELEKSKWQLKEEVAKLQNRLETNMVDRSHTEEYKREVEERAAQERREQLQKVSLFLQAQAASQDRSEEIRTSHQASLRNELQDRIRDLECELDRVKTTQRDSTFSKESMQAEVEKYKGLYLEEVRTRKCLAKNLERANERLAAVNTKLLREHHRSKSSVPSSIVSGHVAATPVLHSTGMGHLGSSLGLHRSLSVGGSFIGAVENMMSTNRRIEARVAKVRQELDEKIARDLQRVFFPATVGPKSGSAGSSKKH
ncbi:ankyrin repeat domain-containing protein 26-like isoform X2 [Pithys albifrons albifrons]|uniref:ankyrin repeat domain-containing protein 26-like isoform X2 n=1 Tax=Pithys albifrons albifrons TaxID=3385563 RepID=UPI003A5CAB46